ncbi:Uu.00g119120.m01.CDS01 [Anthostomella pinea]|uniref:Uu.00g119120.m01.CDS01 n=1 Tax=Anthostomella pinea TaxID=933095 RepID=A0AAI8VGK9_9PEZI|nr:Uu.00g119120.m01.CDS01 [Anthostomella pinea]
MPRQRSAGRPAARPSVPSRAPAPAPNQQQSRPATTYAPAQGAQAQHPPAAAAQGSQGPGLFGQMASTAAGVAVGSSIGHAIGGFFGGGSSEAAPQQQQQTNATAQDSNANQYSNNNCFGATENFTKCMDDHQGNMSICGWYLEQLKACQAAAKQY